MVLGSYNSRRWVLCPLWLMLTISLCGSFYNPGGRSENPELPLWLSWHPSMLIELRMTTSLRCRLQTHVHLFHSFISVLVNKMWQFVDADWGERTKTHVLSHDEDLHIQRRELSYFEGNTLRKWTQTRSGHHKPPCDVLRWALTAWLERLNPRAETSSSPLTPSNDSHLWCDLLNITRLLEHDNKAKSRPHTLLLFEAFQKGVLRWAQK